MAGTWCTAFHNAAAYSSETIEIWFARGLAPGPTQLDIGEFVETCTLSESEYDAAAAAGRIPDMKTMIGLHWLQRWRAGQWPLQWGPAPSALRCMLGIEVRQGTLLCRDFASALGSLQSCASFRLSGCFFVCAV